MTQYNGLVHDLDEQLYHSLPGVSSTGAKKLLQSPAHYQNYINGDHETKPAWDIGSAVHTKVLGVGADIAIYPDGTSHETHTMLDDDGNEVVHKTVLSKTGALGTNASKDFERVSRAAGLIPIKRVQANVINRMAESMLGNDTIRALMSNGNPEVSMFGTDPQTGVDERGRVDWLGRRMVDVKTHAGEATESGFARAVFKFGYDVQFGWYEHLHELITGERLPWLFAVVESQAPYLSNVFVLGEDEQKMGRDKARLARERYAECRESGRWPGYTNKGGGPIGILRAPQFAIYEYIDDYEGAAA